MTPGLQRGRPLNHSTHKVHWIVDFIRRERVQQKLSQDALGRSLGSTIRGHHISNYECGYYSTRTLFSLERILNALGHELHIRRKP